MAALFVLFIHVYQIAAYNGDHRSLSFYTRYSLIGKSMVNLFFVISGFIITYILYKEKIATGRTSLLNFYQKRILRIWPLYFGIFLLVAVLYRFTDVLAPFDPVRGTATWLIVLFAVTFLPFFGDMNLSVFPHYWSLSVEEQFYIFWPIIFKKIKTSRVVSLCVIIILGMVFARNALAYLSSNYTDHRFKIILDVLHTSLFGSLAIGIIGAHLVVHRSSYLRFFYLKPVQYTAWLVFLSTILYPVYIPYVYAEVLAIADLILIINVTTNPQPVISMENRFLDLTGKISYGIYMYHWPLVAILVNMLKKAGYWADSTSLYQIPLLIISTLTVYMVSYLSYNYIESYFLKLKRHT